MIRPLQNEQGLRALRRTNTQTRRLGYIVEITRIINQRYLSPVEVRRKIEAWAEAVDDKLQTHLSSSGVLRRSHTSSGSQRYIELSEDLELITEVTGYLRTAQLGSVLLALDAQLIAHENPFCIRDATPLLLYQLLRLDADYFIPLLRLTANIHDRRELLHSAQLALEEHLRTRISLIQLSRERTSLEDRLRVIRDWTNPVKYLEHLALPRLHWMLDLGLLDAAKYVESEQFVPSVAGRILLRDTETERVPALSWLHNGYWHTCASMMGFQPKGWERLNAQQIAEIVNIHLRLAQRVLPSSIGSRIPAYGLILFVVLRLLLHENVLATFDDIREALARYAPLHNPPYELFWFAGDNDGYLRQSQ